MGGRVESPVASHSRVSENAAPYQLVETLAEERLGAAHVRHGRGHAANRARRQDRTAPRGERAC